MPECTANGYTTHYELDDFTDPWKPADTIVIQHGLGRSSQYWYHWVPGLARNYRVIRRDLRGHGQSADPGSDYQWSLEDLLDDLKSFLDHLGLDRVHYIGESTGGILGVEFAVRWPERFRSLTLCATPAAIRPPVQKFFALGHKDWQTALQTLGSGGYARELIARGGAMGGSNSAYWEWVIKEYEKTPVHALVGYSRLVSKLDMTPKLQHVAVPTLILAPTRSAATPLSEQIMIRDSIPNAKIATIEGRGHEIYVDEPDDCIHAVRRFLASLA